MTITTPAGNKIRCTSNRRYFVIADSVNRPDGTPKAAWVVKRTDSLITAGKAAHSAMFFSADTSTHGVIYDSLNREVIQ